MVNMLCEFRKRTTAWYSPDHFFNHLALFFLRLLEVDLLSQYALGMKILCPSGLRKRNMNGKIVRFGYHHTLSSSSVNSVLASNNRRVRLTFLLQFLWLA